MKETHPHSNFYNLGVIGFRSHVPRLQIACVLILSLTSGQQCQAKRGDTVQAGRHVQDPGAGTLRMGPRLATIIQ
jgi:hypothetical protein